MAKKTTKKSTKSARKLITNLPAGVAAKDDTAGMISTYAKVKGITLDDARERLISVGYRRLMALATFAKNSQK